MKSILPTQTMTLGQSLILCIHFQIVYGKESHLEFIRTVIEIAMGWTETSNEKPKKNEQKRI